MEKIVILTSRPEPDNTVVALLNTLFPDCKIQIVFRDIETFEQCQGDSSSGLPMTDTIRRR